MERSHTLAAVSCGNSPWYTSDRKLGDLRADVSLVARRKFFAPDGNPSHPFYSKSLN